MNKRGVWGCSQTWLSGQSGGLLGQPLLGLPFVFSLRVALEAAWLAPSLLPYALWTLGSGEWEHACPPSHVLLGSGLTAWLWSHTRCLCPQM